VDPLAAHQRAQNVFAGVLANVTADQLAAPTPCSEWTVGDLIEHVVGGNERVPQWAGGDEQPPARPDDLIQAHRATAAAAQETFARPGALEAMYRLPFGEVPGHRFIGMRTTDVLVHAWDLAAATNQSTDLDPELAQRQLAAGRPFGAEQPCSPDRPPADQLAAFLGRKVQ
jgi:uncharacterized protein (TIGR03086 family)